MRGLGFCLHMRNGTAVHCKCSSVKAQCRYQYLNLKCAHINFCNALLAVIE